jgi:putative DNA primase/helicase
MAHRMVLEMSSSRDKETRAAGLKSQDSGKLSAILREAKAFPTIGVRSTQLDQHDFLLGAPNGVIDLNTGRLLDPNPDLLITQTVSVPYDPDAKCPEFDRFIQTIMKDRKQLADLLIRFLGYSLTGSTEAQKFVLLYGERGRNGKGTLIGTMRRLMGPGLCSIIDKKLLASSESDSARFARASLEGKRLVYANEASKNSKLDVEFVKEFTGTTDGMMMAERKGRDAYEFRNTAKLWYAVNVLPDVEWDGPYSARIVPIPFEQSFYNETESEWRHGDLPRDEGIERRLAEELPGILATLVQGALRWKQKGFNTPPEVAALKRQYKAQTDNVGAWIDECCAISPLAWTKSTDLFDSYAAFMKRSHRGRVGKNSEFYKRLEQVPGIVNQRPKNVSIWRGIELRDPANDPEPEEIRDQDGLQF